MRVTSPRNDIEPYPISWQLAALVVFIATGFVLKSWLLNGLLGPLFLVAVLYVAPTALRRLLRRGPAG